MTMNSLAIALCGLPLLAAASAKSSSPLAANAQPGFFAILVSTVSTDPVRPQQLPGLTIMMGETWIFRIENGQPAGARRAGPDAEPAKSEIKVTLERGNGVTMIITNNSEEYYGYRAFISAKPGHKGNRVLVCPLAPQRQRVEHWPEPFPAIRLADFAEVQEHDPRCE